MSYSNTSEGTLLLWRLMLHSASNVCMLHQTQNWMAEHCIFGGFVIENHINCKYVGLGGMNSRSPRTIYTEAHCDPNCLWSSNAVGGVCAWCAQNFNTIYFQIALTHCPIFQSEGSCIWGLASVVRKREWKMNMRNGPLGLVQLLQYLLYTAWQRQVRTGVTKKITKQQR